MPSVFWMGLRMGLQMTMGSASTPAADCRWERQYPELSVMPHFVAAHQAILDGEIAVLDPKGVSRFELIQPRIANADPNAVAHLARSSPAVLFPFDLLYLDGYDLRNVELGDRRRALEAVVAPSSVIRLSEAFPGSGEELLAAARENEPRRHRRQARLQPLRVPAQP